MNLIKQIFPGFFFYLLPIVLSGCALAPGANIDNKYFGEDTQLPSVESMVDVFPITPELLGKMQAKQLLQSQDKTQPSSSDLMLDPVSYDYYIGVGDVLTIIVYDHPELTIPAGSYRNAIASGNVVYSDGTIFYPYIGMVNVEGSTFKEVRRVIEGRLSEYITDPQVDVKVVAFRSQKAYVTGQVNDPGTLTITDVPITVLDAISQSGGLNDSANWHEVILTREGREIELSVFDMLNNGRLDENFLLGHGDVLHVPDLGHHKVFILGEVGAMTSLDMGNLSFSLTDSIAQSGGIQQTTANAKGVFVIRQSSPGSNKLATIFQLDVSNAIAFALGAQFMLEPSDIVYVTTAAITRWNRVISQLLPTLTAFYRIDDLNYF